VGRRGTTKVALRLREVPCSSTRRTKTSEAAAKAIAEAHEKVGFLAAHIALPPRFRFDQVDPVHIANLAPVPPPDLGPLTAFIGTWKGNGFNTIFRPDSTQTPTPLPTPAGGDNVLELNLTAESLSFSPSLGSVPNRGMVQGDAFLNGVPYLQAISDVTTGQPVGIHLEPGLWIAVPPTSDPAEPTQTLARMASIPHGTTINAQGTASTTTGAPTIPPVDTTPFFSSSGQRIRFPSQTASAQGTARIPQDLTSIPITQAMLDDPNSVLRDHIASQIIISTTTIIISTSPPQPLFGGGTDNIAFLLGFPGATSNPNSSGQNAQTVIMNATFWIETVEHTIVIPPLPRPPAEPIELRPEGQASGAPITTFTVLPPVPIPRPLPITIRTTQIQYSQTVLLNFNGLSWPHVSVATLVPASSVPVTGGWPT
jgi:hypothetical protein